MWVLDGDKKLLLFIYKPKERTKLNKNLIIRDGSQIKTRRKWGLVDIIKVFSFLPFGIFQEEGSWPTACYTNIRNVQFVSIKGKEVYLYLEVTALLKSCPLPTPPKIYIYIPKAQTSQSEDITI